MSRVLVVGGDGLIGRDLIPALRGAGHDAVGTSYRQPLPDGAVNLDLTVPEPDISDGFDAIVIAAAVVLRQDCEADPDRARLVNVDAPLALAAPVLARGGQVIFLSTSIVLGGDRPHLPVDAPYAPFDVYSRLKAEAEQRLRTLPGADHGLAVLRLAKVLDASYGVIAAWAKAAEDGRPITPFTDLVTAPMTVGHVVGKITAMIDARTTGIHHLSGIEHTYAEIAKRLGAELGWPDALIQPQEGRQNNPIAAQNPPHASLEAERPMLLDEVIGALVKQLS
ncbi:MAG: sugar nucleotide-binding protein [Pseudomonadota bacterium]